MYLILIGHVSQVHLWVGYGIISIFLFLFTGATSSLFWVAAVCTLLVSIHGGFMDKPLEADFEETV